MATTVRLVPSTSISACRSTRDARIEEQLRQVRSCGWSGSACARAARGTSRRRRAVPPRRPGRRSFGRGSSTERAIGTATHRMPERARRPRRAGRPRRRAPRTPGARSRRPRTTRRRPRRRTGGTRRGACAEAPVHVEARDGQLGHRRQPSLAIDSMQAGSSASEVSTGKSWRSGSGSACSSAQVTRVGHVHGPPAEGQHRQHVAAHGVADHHEGGRLDAVPLEDAARRWPRPSPTRSRRARTARRARSGRPSSPGGGGRPW